VARQSCKKSRLKIWSLPRLFDPLLAKSLHYKKSSPYLVGVEWVSLVRAAANEAM